MTDGIIRPKLQRGDRVAVVSPASYARADLVEAGCAHLRAHGYDPVVMPHALDRGPLYYAGKTSDRLADLHAAFADESVRGIFCTRGGWGSAELLPFLDRELIRAKPKVFVGYSDHTSLQAWFWNECRMQTYYAPMVAADWSRVGGADLRSWRLAIEAADERWHLGTTDGMTGLREGVAQGTLLGGCLAIVAEALGTPWALKTEQPTVLFLEDIGIKPYQWDRMLQHLQFAGMFEHVTGIVLGDMSSCGDANDVQLIRDACLHALRDFHGPIAIGLRCGHVAGGNRSLRLGAQVELRCGTDATLTFLA